MTSSIIDFLEARLKEDEAAARETAAEGVDNILWRVWAGALDARAYLREEGGTEEDYERMQKNQIARARRQLALGDPARVLREVQAKRRVLERHCLYDGIGSKYTDYCMGCPSGDDSGYPEVELDECPELRDLAAPYSDHPDYRKEWAA